MSLLSLLCVLMFAVGAEASRSCAASSKSCEFYSCMEQKTHCGSFGYWKQLGQRYCQKFLFREEEFSPRAQKWLKDSRRCLQERVAWVENEEISCREIRNVALDSHVGCYIDTGFCSLSRADKNRIYWYLASAFWHPHVWKEAIEVGRICRQGNYELVTPSPY